MSGKHEWLQDYITSVISAMGAMDFGTLQPFDHLQFHPLKSKEWVTKIEQFVKRAKEQQISPRELAALWPSMAGLRCQMYFLLLDFKCAQIPAEKRLELIQFFFDMLQEGAKEDVHGLTSNIRRTDGEIKQLVQQKKLRAGTPVIARKLGQIYNALYNLGAGYYVDFYLDYSAENEGSYDVSDIYGPGHILVIKHVKGMKPVELFPEAQDFVAENFTIYAVYKDVKFATNLVSLHSTYEGDVINSLKYWGLEVDGRMVDEQELDVFLQKSAHASIEQWQLLKALSFEEQKVKAAEIRCFGMRKLFERVGMDWRPSQKMIEALKGKPFKDNSYWNIPRDDKRNEEYWRRIYDPREEFYPGDSVENATE
ncbi:hypothetical protein HY497_00590 [Candidatus Woesearchaeota archaeon]|nr:hypothetical protein [Candidatus Woesearchaeota archaeon]